MLVLYPSSLLQRTFDIAISADADEDFRILIDPVFLLPLSHICNVQEYLFALNISINEALDSLLIVRLHFDWNHSWASNAIASFELIAAVLLLSECWHILELFCMRQDLLTGFLKSFLLLLLFSVLLCFLLVHLLFELLHLLLLSSTNRFRSLLLCGSSSQLLLLLILIKGFLVFRAQCLRFWEFLIRGSAPRSRSQCSSPFEICSCSTLTC